MIYEEIFAMVRGIIERTRNDIFGNDSIDDKSKYDENIENINKILEDEKAHLLDQKKVFDELHNKNKIGFDNYMLFIDIINTFNEFYSEVYKLTNNENINVLLNNYQKIADYFLFHLKTLSNKEKGLSMISVYFQQYKYVPVENIIKELIDLSLNIGQEVDLINKGSVSKKYGK